MPRIWMRLSQLRRKDPTMRHLANRLQFNGPIDRVFELAIDPTRWTEYMPWVSDVIDIRGRGDKVGDSARFTDHALARSLAATAVVTEVDPPRLQTVETTYEDGSRIVMRMRFTPVDGRTEIASDVDYELGTGLVAGARELVSRPFIERRLLEIGERFANLLEPLPV
jgi:uncharacterized protein YndB with AHSA1/START domain